MTPYFAVPTGAAEHRDPAPAAPMPAPRPMPAADDILTQPPIEMNFRARLAVVLFLAPLVLAAVLLFAMAALNPSEFVPAHNIPTGLSVAATSGAVLAGGAWSLLTVLKWLVMGRV